MKNQIILLSLLFLLSAGYSQTDTSIRRRTVSKVGNIGSTEFYLRQDRKEKELSQLKKQYFLSQNTDRKSIKAKMLVILYELFDLSMMKKYSEAEQFRQLLQQMENHQDYQDKNNEIATLKLKLELVEKQIKEREKLRDEIVATRLQEILKEN